MASTCLTALQLETPVVPRVFKAPTPVFPLLPATHHPDTLMRHCPPHHHYHYLFSSSLLSLSSFLFVFFVPSWSLSVHYCSSLKCSTSNTTSVQVDVFRCPLIQTHTQAHARSQTEAELLNGAAAREIRARLHYERKLADFIKGCSVNKRTGCPD